MKCGDYPALLSTPMAPPLTVAFLLWSLARCPIKLKQCIRLDSHCAKLFKKRRIMPYWSVPGTIWCQTAVDDPLASDILHLQLIYVLCALR